jgi:hypothetical protein
MNIKLKAMLYTAAIIGGILGLGFLLSLYPSVGIGILVAIWLTLFIRLVYRIVLGFLGD